MNFWYITIKYTMDLSTASGEQNDGMGIAKRIR